MLWPLLKGLSVTLKYFFTRPVTMKYPEERWVPGPRWRGRQQLLWDEARSREKCVACCLCATVCPAQCIRVEGAENERHEKYPTVYEIDLNRCIFCGFCVEACPVGAITMTGAYELAEYTRGNNIYDRHALLLEPKLPPGAEQSTPFSLESRLSEK
jgi:NADH-quinone oxidoreductase subunit I